MKKHRLRITDDLTFATADNLKKRIESADNFTVVVSLAQRKDQKVFFAPFKNKNYYKFASYEDVLERVVNDVLFGVYFRAGLNGSLIPAEAIYDRDRGRKWLKRHYELHGPLASIDLVKNTLDSYPNLLGFEGEPLPVETFILRSIGQLVCQAIYGAERDVQGYKLNAELRDAARRDIIDNLLERPILDKGQQKGIPRNLYLKALRHYLHKITEHLKRLYLKYDPTAAAVIDEDEIETLSKIDWQLVEIYNAGLLKKLCGKKECSYVTDFFIAKFFHSTVKSLRQHYKAEPDPPSDLSSLGKRG